MRSEELARPTKSSNLGGQVRLSQILLLVDMFMVFPLIALRIVPYMIPYLYPPIRFPAKDVLESEGMSTRSLDCSSFEGMA